MYLLENTTSPATSAAPALANFALLMAEGSAIKYVEILNDLYVDNGLHAPDFTKYLPQSEVTYFEEDASFMEELDEYQNTGSLTTAFTKNYYELCPQEARDFEDWFDIDEGFVEDNSGCVESSSTPRMSQRKSIPKDLKSKLLIRNSNLLFNLTAESVPDQVLDNAIHQAEDLNETIDFPRLCLDLSASDSDEDTFQQSDETMQELIENLFDISSDNETIDSISSDSNEDTFKQNDETMEELIENVFDISSDNETIYAISSDIDTYSLHQGDQTMQQLIDDLNDILGDSEDDSMIQLIGNMKFLIQNATEQLNPPTTPMTNNSFRPPQTPQRRRPRSIFGRESPLRIASDYMDLTPRHPSRPAARRRPQTSVSADGRGHQAMIIPDDLLSQSKGCSDHTQISCPITPDQRTYIKMDRYNTPNKAVNIVQLETKKINKRRSTMEGKQHIKKLF